MKRLPISLKRSYSLYRFYLAALLSFAGACPSKKTARHASSLSKSVQGNGPNAIQPFAPTLEKVKNNRSNAVQPSAPTSRQVPIHTSSSRKEDQESIKSDLTKMVQEEKVDRENFSKKLDQIPMTDTLKRDEMISAFVAEREKRIKMFEQLAKKISDFNENQQFLMSFINTKEMSKEINLLNGQYISVSNPTDLKKKNKNHGDITEKYNGYPVESKRSQFRRQVKDIIDLVANNPSILPNKQENDPQCAICHTTGSFVGLLPCGDYVHVNCLVEDMIFVWRRGSEFLYKCPGSCGGYLNHNHFLSYNAHEKPLTLDALKKVVSVHVTG